ncbi:MAG: SMI1/KNR4 family protein [Moraxella sp.]|nr:SMI1/KNR4 family protein [Moraxella sp.]
MSNIYQDLKRHILTMMQKKDWEHFEKIKQGATTEDIEKIKNVYPNIPNTLISILEYVDGTYWREYAGEEITFYFLGSDVEEYPYYLLSSKQIIENQNEAYENYSDYIDRQYDGVEIDDKITKQSNSLKWLHFSDCSNNGGTSQLFIDFSPSDKGKMGQIVRFLHDPDEFSVITESFEEYLKKLIENGYDFINEDTVN